MSLSLQEQVLLWCQKHNVMLPKPQYSYSLPNGTMTNDKTRAQEAWELDKLRRNVFRTNDAKKLKYAF
mgnify:CR=1 FL=1